MTDIITRAHNVAAIRGTYILFITMKTGCKFCGVTYVPIDGFCKIANTLDHNGKQMGKVVNTWIAVDDVSSVEIVE